MWARSSAWSERLALSTFLWERKLHQRKVRVRPVGRGFESRRAHWVLKMSSPFCPNCGNLIINGSCSCNSKKKSEDDALEMSECSVNRKKKVERPTIERLLLKKEGNRLFIKKGILDKKEKYTVFVCNHEVEVYVPYSLINSDMILVRRSDVDCEYKNCRIRHYCIFSPENEYLVERILYEKGML